MKAIDVVHYNSSQSWPTLFSTVACALYFLEVGSSQILTGQNPAHNIYKLQTELKILIKPPAPDLLWKVARTGIRLSNADRLEAQCKVCIQ